LKIDAAIARTADGSAPSQIEKCTEEGVIIRQALGVEVPTLDQATVLLQGLLPEPVEGAQTASPILRLRSPGGSERHELRLGCPVKTQSPKLIAM
jgi:hypothetical protein